MADAHERSSLVLVQLVVVIKFIVLRGVVRPNLADRLELLILVLDLFEVPNDGGRSADALAVVDELRLVRRPGSVLKILR